MTKLYELHELAWILELANELNIEFRIERVWIKQNETGKIVNRVVMYI